MANVNPLYICTISIKSEVETVLKIQLVRNALFDYLERIKHL